MKKLKDGKKRLIICPKCGKKGWLQYKSIRHYYYPKASSSKIEKLKDNEKKLQRGSNEYLLNSSTDSLKRSVRINIKGKRDAVKSKVMRFLYVGHYDHYKYKDTGNGRTWCYYPLNPKLRKRTETIMTHQIELERQWKLLHKDK